MVYKIKKIESLYLKRYNAEKNDFAQMFENITDYGWECFNREFDKLFDKEQNVKIRKILKLHRLHR